MATQRQELTTQRFSFTPTTLKEAQEYATIIATSGICPESFRGRPNDVLIVLQLGSELGLKPMQALRSLGSINGMPFAYGDGLLALVKRHPQFDDMKEWFEGNMKDGSLTAYCTMIRKGKEPVTQSFSIEDAKHAGLWGKKGPWTAYPKRMLQHRARGFAARDGFPDALYGLMSEEEANGVAETKRPTIAPAKNKGMAGLEESLGLNEEVIEGEIVEQDETGVEELTTLIAALNVPEKSIKKWCTQFNVESIEQIPLEGKQKIMDYLKSKESHNGV